MNIFFAVNDGYAEQLCVCLVSILENNQTEDIHFHILSNDFSKESKKKVQNLKKKYKNWDISYFTPDKKLFANLKLNIEHITIETYFRYIIANLEPQLEKCLYLDADLIVNGSLKDLWNTALGDCYCAGVKDLFIERSGHKKNIHFNENDLYINAGVLLLNLTKIRQEKMVQKLFDNTISLFDKISYQDQDIINITFKGHLKELDTIYNFTAENVKREKRKSKKAVVIHYTGKRKPWHKDCKNKLAFLWLKYAKLNNEIQAKKIKVGLLIDEFFGGAKTAFGGYGFLARKYIAKYIPNEDIQIDVLLGKGKRKFWAQHFHEDDVDLYRLPRNKYMAQRWLKKQNYDIYLSIELTSDFVLRHETNPDKKLILWIQDPRPKSAWDNVIDTMQSIKDPCFYTQKNYDMVHNLAQAGRVKFISQGYSLNHLAIELYNLPADVQIQYLPNPVDIDFDFEFDLSQKKKQIIFLGRLEAQKRAWLFCEIAKQLPEYDFYVLGQFFRYKEDNERMLAPYITDNIKNLHFVGHVDGEKKKQLIKESRLLLSTAIWEGIPISWLETLSYGTILISDLERENLATQFGKFIGEIPGDGFDGIQKFIPAIKELMENDILYENKAITAIKYIRDTHNISRFVQDLRAVIYEETSNSKDF